ncbi:MAG TPA: LacI family DNA-binding transcriptional regulator [Atribacteraceae bacterium]|nr:LacI family DNA-binding transcriptional regulator [Atribacteraceae bacterium]
MVLLTISEIAFLAGVSKATVSNVLNERTKQVSPKTRQRIETIIKENGYVPRHSARSLKTNRTKTLGLLFPHLPAAFFTNTFFFPGFLTGVAKACEKFSYQLIITTSSKSCDTSFHYESLVQSKSVDGLIVSEIFIDDQRFSVLEQFDIPFVSIGKPEGRDINNISWVDHDQEQVAYQAVRYLIDLGHRDILFLGLSPSRVFTKQRLEGYKRALMDSKIPFQEDLIICEEITKGEVKKALSRPLNKGVDFSAIFVISEPLVLESMKALKELGLRVSRDISFLANIETDNYLYYVPPLTGIKIKTEELGFETAKLLVQIIEGEIRKPVGKFLEADFVEGASCSSALFHKKGEVI